MQSISDKIEDLRFDVRSISTSSSKTSRRSSTSSRSRASRYSHRSHKLDGIGDEATLRMKLEFLDAEAKQKMELERIQFKKELAIAESRCKAQNVSKLNPIVKAYVPNAHYNQMEDLRSEEPCYTEHKSTLRVGNLEAQFNRLASTLVDQVQISRLPPEPGTFSGDPLKYAAWRRTSFDLLINNRSITDVERLHYLMKY